MVDSDRLPAVEYPETDGNPMPDGDYQGDFYRYAVDAVRAHFLQRPEVYVTGNLFIYLEEGNPKNRIAPDMYVVMNGGHRMRDTYKVWEEPGGMPNLVLEIVSPSTWRTDLGPKRDHYAALGVGEYWLYDPHANFMHPALAGFRLAGGAYAPTPGIESPEGTLTIRSETLGLDLCLQGENLRFFDPVRGKYLLNRAEAQTEIHAAKDKARAAQARIAELERALAEKKVAEARGAAGDSHESLAIDVPVANRRVMPASTHTRRASSKCSASLSAWTGGIPVRMTGSNGRPGRVGDTNRRHFGQGSMTCTKRPPANLGRFTGCLLVRPHTWQPTSPGNTSELQDCMSASTLAAVGSLTDSE